MGKIGEIWAKLGLKKDEFDKGLDNADKKAKGFGSSLKSMGASAKAAWALVGTAAVAAVSKFINSSQTLGDAWAKTMSGMTSRWQNFISQVNRGIADKNNRRNFLWNPFGFWGQIFGSGESGTAKMAGEAKSVAQDAMFEIENAFKIATSEMAPRLNELYLKMMNTALSGKERAAAGAEYRSLLEPLYGNRAQGYKDFMNATVQNWAAVGGISGKYSNEQIVNLVKMMGTNSDYVQQNFGDFYAAYQSMSDTLTQEMVDAIVAYNNAANELNDSLRRIDRVAMNAANIGANSKSDEKPKETDSGAIVDGMIDDVAQRILDGKYEVESAWSDILDLVDVEWELPELDISNAEASLDKLLQDWQQKQQEMMQWKEAFSSALEQGIEGGIASFAEGIGQLAAGGGIDEFAATMLSQMGSFAKQFGSMLIEFGVAAVSLKKLITNPFAAIAAGAALVALGSFASKKAQALTDNFTGSSTTASSGGTSSQSVESQSISTEMTIYVKGKIDGKDILLSGQRAAQYYGR